LFNAFQWLIHWLLAGRQQQQEWETHPCSSALAGT
jgi:hypothetical protein